MGWIGGFRVGGEDIGMIRVVVVVMEAAAEGSFGVESHNRLTK